MTDVQFVHHSVHTPDDVRNIIGLAMHIASDRSRGDDKLWFAIFREACRLLGQRATATVEQQEPVWSMITDGVNTVKV